jgi:hypothetical protein
MVHILREGPRSRYKIRNTHLISEPNKEKWVKFFMKLGSSTIGWVKTNEEGNIVGLILGMITENFWDTQTVGKIILWYVDPEYRGVPAIRLMQNLIQWFSLQKADYIISNCDFSSDAGKAYRRLGFKPLEETLYLVEG